MSLRQSLTKLASGCVSIIKTRLELLSLEASDQKSDLIWLIGMTLSAVLLLGAGLFLLSLTVALLFWSTGFRYLALVLLTILYLGGGSYMLLRVRRKLLNSSLPFSATLEELSNDLALLNEMSKSESRKQARNTHPTDDL